MAVKRASQQLNLWLFLGAVLVSYGLGEAYLETAFNYKALAAVVLGVACLLVCALRIRRLMRASSVTGRWKRYVLFCLLAVLWTALYVEVNYFASRRDVRWDFTKNKLHTLSAGTQDVITDLLQQIRVTAFYVGLPPKYLEDLLREYERQSNGKIITEIIDPLVQIGYAAQFGNVISGKEQKVFIQSGNERREIDFTDGVLTEEELTNAVLRVTRKVRRACFLTGHSESDISDEGDAGLFAFQTLLAANNILAKRLMIGIEGDVPKDCDVLVLAGPKAPLSKTEEDVIKAFLNGGGDALFLVEHTVITTPDQPLGADQVDMNPSLNSILNDWGVTVAQDVVVDLASHASGDVGSPATRNYMAHRSIVNDLDYTFFVRPRSVSIVNNRRPTLKLAPIILTASEEKSWGETNRNLEVKFDEGVDRAGPVPIAFAIWEPKLDIEGSDTRIIVITDADFITNAFIGQYSNARLGINTLNWLTETDYKVFMDKKTIEISRLDLTSRQKRMVAVILFLMPLSIIIIGVMVWIRQRFV